MRNQNSKYKNNLPKTLGRERRKVNRMLSKKALSKRRVNLFVWTGGKKNVVNNNTNNFSSV